MTTEKPVRKRIEPGLYRRGDLYEIRIGYRDSTGRRHDQWRTIGTSKRAAKGALVEARAEAQRQQIVPGARKLTVGSFLGDQFLPYLDERVAAVGDLHPNTALRYREYVLDKVIPRIGHLKLGDVNSGHIERLLTELRVGGRDPRAGVGRPRSHPDFVYDVIGAKRQEGWSHSDVALWLATRHPQECGRLTKDAVAAIWRRDVKAQGGVPPIRTLEVSTVQKVRTTLRSAWNFGVSHGLISRDRAQVVAAARVPARARDDRKPEVVCWTTDQYRDFFDWAVHHRRMSRLLLKFGGGPLR